MNRWYTLTAWLGLKSHSKSHTGIVSSDVCPENITDQFAKVCSFCVGLMQRPCRVQNNHHDLWKSMCAKFYSQVRQDQPWGAGKNLRQKVLLFSLFKSDPCHSTTDEIQFTEGKTWCLGKRGMQDQSSPQTAAATPRWADLSMVSLARWTPSDPLPSDDTHRHGHAWSTPLHTRTACQSCQMHGWSWTACNLGR